MLPLPGALIWPSYRKQVMISRQNLQPPYEKREGEGGWENERGGRGEGERYHFGVSKIDINFTYQHRHNKRGPEFVVGNHFETSLSPDKELKASTNSQIHHHHKKESVQSQWNSTFFVILSNHQDLHSNEYPSNVVNYCFHNWVIWWLTSTSIWHNYNILQVEVN